MLSITKCPTVYSLAQLDEETEADNADNADNADAAPGVGFSK